MGRKLYALNNGHSTICQRPHEVCFRKPRDDPALGAGGLCCLAGLLPLGSSRGMWAQTSSRAEGKAWRWKSSVPLPCVHGKG